jgi:endoglucanase
MRTIRYRAVVRALLLSLAPLALAAAGEPPAELRRGINITNWFRFPPSRDPAALRSYLDDAALEDLKRAGFGFIRLPVQADLITATDALTDAVARIQRHGLAVVVALFASDWHLETQPDDRARLVATWRRLAPALRRFDPARTFPEILNEPVFAGDPGSWARLQHETLAAIRSVLPANTIVLTGANWSSIAGLLAQPVESDASVIYTFHIYQPAELTALGAYRTGLDGVAMARLPFPVVDPAACTAVAATAHDAPTAELIRFYCTQGWDVAKLSASISEAAAWARRHRVTVLAGEFGASRQLNAPARLAWFGTVRAALEHEGIGWALWGYDDSMGFALHPPGGSRRLDTDVLRALGLPSRK